MRKLLILLVLSFGSRAAVADEAFSVLGARAGGLGGAFTAVADDATAFHWNPAGVARGAYVRLGFYGDTAFQDRGAMIERLQSGRPGDGAELDGDRAWGFATAFTVLGFSVSRSTHTSSILESESIRSRGLRTWDFAATFVQSLPLDDLIVGFNLRYIRGTAFAGTTPVSEIPPDRRRVDDLIDRAVDGVGRTEAEPGLDLGVMYQPRDWIRLGVSGRNLNRPTFHAENQEPFSLERHARAGVAFFLPRDLLVALDVDVSRRVTETARPGWREVAAGVEKSWAEGRFVLRGGVRTEVSGGSVGRPGFAGGLGVKMAGIAIDLAALTGTEKRMGALWLGISFVP